MKCEKLKPMLKKCKNFFIFFEKTIDKHNKLCYNKDNEREVISMFLVVWKYIDEDKVQGSVMTSRELMFLRLDPNVRVEKIEEV